MDDRFKKAGIIIIGDEILKGHVKDLNSNFLCKRFHAIGVKVCRVTTVPDQIEDIAEEVARFSEKFDIVITTGGIGSTHDDITYEAIAVAMNDKTILNPEMAEIIKCYFNGDDDLQSNPALKMALIPKSSKLIHVLPKSEKEVHDSDKHNGLQIGRKTFSTPKKSFPVVQVKNVYVLPGMMEWLEHAFNHLLKIFGNPPVDLFTMVLFLNTSEFKIVNQLNSAVDKFRDKVIFGSYPANCKGDKHLTKITLESTSLDDVCFAFRYLKSILCPEYLAPELSLETAELVYELTNGTKSLHEALRNSIKVIETALMQYKEEEIYLSFNGGKDCTVLLHLVWAVYKKQGTHRKLNTIHIRSGASFSEVDLFINKMVEKYDLHMQTVFGPIKNALTVLHKDNPEIKAIFMGTRRTDPHAEQLQEFQMCDKDWPPLMRVNPILDWSYENIWQFLRVLNVPYCSLYDKGYTSIGSPRNTEPNPALKVPNFKDRYYPAYMLKNDGLERQGRH